MPTSDQRESPWATTVVLGNGDTAFIRPLTRLDKAALGAFHRSQKPESIYRRYFSPKPELNDKELDHFTDVDMVDRAALAVESHDEFIAWASYERWPGRDEAEAAFMVADDHQGEGIATLLLEHLAAIARSNGINRFTAEVLGDNRAMLAVFAKAGWPLQRRFDSGVVDLDWELADTDEYLDSVERREQRADARAVARLLLPKAIAVIGASPHAGSVGGAAWTNAIRSVDVPVYAVNPHHDEIDGHRCLHSVDELPDEVSLAIVAVPASALEATIDACIAKRMRGAVVITTVDSVPPIGADSTRGRDGVGGGSSSVGDNRRPGSGPTLDVPALVARARRNGLRIIGPSSMGVASPLPDSHLQAALVEVTLPPGGVAISMQSGSLGGSLLRKARDLDLGVSWFVSLGDKSDISGNDLLQFWEHDEYTKVIAMYTETFGNPRKFVRLARRISRSRPIVAVRTGAAAMGDMGSAMYQQAGLIEVPTVPALLDTVRVLATQPVLGGPRVAVVTNSQSPGTLASAALEAAGLQPVDGPIPLDWHARAEHYPDAIRAALSCEDIDGVLAIFAPAVEADVSAAEAIAAGPYPDDKPLVAVLLGGGDGPVTPGSSVPSFSFPEQAAAVLGRSYAYGHWLRHEASTEPAPGRPVDPEAAKAIIATVVDPDGRHASPAGSAGPVGTAPNVDVQRRLLATYGIEMAEAIDTDPDHALDDARRLGYPVALKSLHRRPGRSARAGVALDLFFDDDVTQALATMQESLGDDAEHLVVQRMTVPGVDVRIRCEHDDRLGAIVSVGLGGSQADAIADRTSRLAPVTPASASTMLSETKVTLALATAGFDTSPLVDAIVQAGQLVSDHPEIAELDLNPVIVSEQGAIVTDSIMRLAPYVRDNGPIRRLD